MPDKFILGSVPLAIGNQSVGLWRWDAQLEHYAGGQEFGLGSVGLETWSIKFSQREAVLSSIGKSRPTLAGLDVVIQIDSQYIFAHNFARFNFC